MDFDRITNRRATRSLKWTRYAEDVLPLWVADMDFPAPEPVREALRGALEHGIFGYEMPSRRLYETVAARMHRLYGWEITADMVLAIPGLVSAFNVAARVVCQTGEGILMQPPVYHPFLQVPANVGAVRQFAPLRQVNIGSLVRFETDWEAFEAALHSPPGARTALFLFCHPHNPVGRGHTRGELERYAELCLRHNVVICSDEIHSELLLGDARHLPIATLGPEVARQTITLIAPSKTFNLAGLFCGFAIIPDPGLRASCERALRNLVLHVNSFGLLAAEIAFSGACDPWLAALRDYLTANRDYLVDYVRAHLPGARVSRPEATYLAWLDFADYLGQGKISGEPARFLLERAKVALNPGGEFGPGGETFARLNFGCPRATLAAALERIRSVL